MAGSKTLSLAAPFGEAVSTDGRSAPSWTTGGGLSPRSVADSFRDSAHDSTPRVRLRPVGEPVSFGAGRSCRRPSLGSRPDTRGFGCNRSDGGWFEGSSWRSHCGRSAMARGSDVDDSRRGVSATPGRYRAASSVTRTHVVASTPRRAPSRPASRPRTPTGRRSARTTDRSSAPVHCVFVIPPSTTRDSPVT